MLSLRVIVTLSLPPLRPRKERGALVYPSFCRTRARGTRERHSCVATLGLIRGNSGTSLCDRMNSFHVVVRLRSGAGAIWYRRKMLPTVWSEIRWPRFESAPTMRS